MGLRARSIAFRRKSPIRELLLAKVLYILFEEKASFIGQMIYLKIKNRKYFRFFSIAIAYSIHRAVVLFVQRDFCTL